MLGRDAWVEEALRALASGGLAAISVERLAVSLGVTKGSFYWHFESRDALVRAVLERWEAVGTEDVIAALDAIADPMARLRHLVTVSFENVEHLRAEASLQAAASAGDRVVGPIVARVLRRRLAYTESIYRAIGLPRAEASRRAAVAIAAYLGSVLLASQGLLGEGERAMRHQLRTLEAMLVPDGE